jgi:hypothetical protein
MLASRVEADLMCVCPQLARSFQKPDHEFQQLDLGCWKKGRSIEEPDRSYAIAGRGCEKSDCGFTPPKSGRWLFESKVEQLK